MTQPAAMPSSTPVHHLSGLAGQGALNAVLRRALDTDRISLAFQPVVRASEPDEPVFHEALIRLEDDTGRRIAAGDFMPAVEATDIGRALDIRALEIGLTALAADPELRLSINASARSIGHPPWRDTLERGLSRDATLAGRLILEATEASALDLADTLRPLMDALQPRGVSFALDDFGAGYSSFRYLKDFDFDILKIDGRYSCGIHSDVDNRVLMQALVDLAVHFGMFSVAEAVETERDAATLRDMGIDGLQGYLFARPAAAPLSSSDLRQLRAVA